MKNYIKNTTTVFLIMICTLVNAKPYELSDEDIQYNKLIDKFESSCESIGIIEIPKSLFEMFCHPNPINQIAARYCLLQNVKNPDNDESISFKLKDKEKDNTKTTITVSVQCKIQQI